MDELILHRLFGSFGGFGGGFDLTALLAFIAYGIVYLLVPVLGYEEYRPTGLTLALYLMVGYGGVSVLQSLMLWMQLLDQPRHRGFVQGEAGFHAMLALTILKLILFLAAMVAFIAGLRSLRFRPTSDDS